MKKALAIICATLCFVQANAQLNKFAGTWKWGSKSDSLVVALQIQNIIGADGVNRQVIIGWYKYIKNGKVLIDNLPVAGANFNPGFSSPGIKSSIIGFACKPDKLNIKIMDKAVQNNDASFILLAGGIRAKWIIKPTNALTENIKLPENIVLLKDS